MAFKPLDPQPDFVSLEHEIEKYWEDKDILAKYLHRNDAAKKNFSFLDGPITANNPMALHHAWGRTLKDVYQRYKNMQGFKQRFQNGFDNQGLWVEVEVEKKLGFKTKKDIEAFGIDKFVAECKKHTLEFAAKQTEQSQRLGYFMDWGRDYYTMSDENNYAIWYFLKKCWQDGNLYKGKDSVPWCPRCGTAISQHEILNEEYKEVTHDSIYFQLPIEGRENEFFLVWTTTPWTLPANVALAVHPDLEYWLVKGFTGLKFWVVSSLAKAIFGESVKPERSVVGSKLVGLRYRAPFDELPAVQLSKKSNPETFHTVVASKELVNGQEGTGIVHIAPGCGQEDFALGKEAGLPVIEAIDEAANYLDGFGDLSGKNAKNDPDLVLRHPLLTGNGKHLAPSPTSEVESAETSEVEDMTAAANEDGYIFKISPYTHRYPVCWRCKTELVWRVVDEWYIRMDELRPKMIALAEKINWIPSFGKDLELDWLKNMHDWLVSKKRYWGLCLPIWECACGNFEVIGSKEELKERAVQGWEEFEGQTPHRPWVDKVKIKCSKCGLLASRISDVGNPWLDAGIVAYSTLKYFEDKEYWKKWFPADLVLESFPGQFKNWFYSLIATSAALENKPPFKTLLGYALVLDEKGEIMHKSAGNAIWFDDAAEKIGSDILRWMFARQNPAQNIYFGYKMAEEVRRRFFLILWNSFNFFITFANLDRWEPKPLKQTSEVGRQDTTSEVVLDVLDRWILSRFNNLVIEVTKRLEAYENNKAAEAIEHFVVEDLSSWYIRRSRDRVGEEFFTTTRHVLFNLLRLMAPFTPFVTEHLYQALGGRNHESIHLEDWPQADKSLVDEELEKEMSLAREIAEKGHALRRESGIKVRQPLAELSVYLPSPPSEPSLPALIAEEVNVKKVVFVEALRAKPLRVELDVAITPALKLEGEAREMMREVQDLRKKSGCKLSDTVKIEYPARYNEVVGRFGDEIKKKTLVSELRLSNAKELAIIS